MELKGFISISGMPGIYKVVGQTKSGFIVESLTDKKRFPVTAANKVSSLEDISIFTTGDDLPLPQVFEKIRQKNNGELDVDPKADPAKLKEYFKSVLPEFDEARVYNSDIKKVIGWYALLKEKIKAGELDKKEETDPLKTDASNPLHDIQPHKPGVKEMAKAKPSNVSRAGRPILTQNRGGG